MEATTEMCVRSSILPLSRRYRTDLLALTFHQLKMQCFTDTLFGGVKPLMSNTRAQLFIDVKYIYIHPMKSKKEASYGLQNFTEYRSIPAVILRNIYGEQTSHNTEFMKLIKKYCIGDRTDEKYFPRKNVSDNPI